MPRRLTEAFNRMNAAGIIAREDFSCCSGCAGAEITTLADEMIAKGKSKESIHGCCFYHAQDNEALEEEREKMMLRYGVMESSTNGIIGAGTLECGESICQILDDVGISFDWNGDPSACIEVDVSDCLSSFYGVPVDGQEEAQEADQGDDDCVPGTSIPKPTVRLMDGNAMAIMGAVSRELRRAGVSSDIINEFRAKATSGDYNNVICTAMDYAEVE